MATISFPILQQGFEFCPTDEDLVLQYLRRRAVNEPLPSSNITDVDILAHNPWDLVPGTEGVTEKYYFSKKVLRWSQGKRCKRATKDGFWKASGLEVPIIYNSNTSGVSLVLGVKKTMVFYRGKARGGERTEWTMHEYRLLGAGLTPYRVMRPVRNNDLGNHGPTAAISTKVNDEPAGAPQDAAGSNVPMAPVLVNPDDSWVICHIYKRTGRMPHVSTQENRVVEERQIPFYDFFAQGNREVTAAQASSQEGSTE
ncbi:hypothetical protein ACP4OV_008939 [Aristida adscensionis]